MEWGSRVWHGLLDQLTGWRIGHGLLKQVWAQAEQDSQGPMDKEQWGVAHTIDIILVGPPGPLGPLDTVHLVHPMHLLATPPGCGIFKPQTKHLIDVQKDWFLSLSPLGYFILL